MYLLSFRGEIQPEHTDLGRGARPEGGVRQVLVALAAVGVVGAGGGADTGGGLMLRGGGCRKEGDGEDDLTGKLILCLAIFVPSELLYESRASGYYA